MPNQTACPDREVLQRLLLGQLSPDQARPVEEHLAGCSRCGRAMETIDADDDLLAAIRAQAGASVTADTGAVETLIRAMCGLRASGPQGGAAEASTVLPEDLGELLDPPQMPDEIGRLGRYRVLRILGAGGMGVVLEAEDTQLGRRVAIKIMKRALAASQSARKRFLREAKAAAAVEHAHVVTVYDVGEHRGQPYLAMQFLEGQSLRARLRQSPIPAAEAIEITRQIAEGLAAAHRQGVIHRDIKPDNIWLEAGDDRVKILDFGLARVADDAGHLTQTGAIAGTPAYMAPEQARGEPADERSDLFSVGAVLYEMCTGRAAFAGANTASMLMAVAHNKPPPPHRVAPTVPRRLSDLVMKLLEKDPARRFQTAEELSAALSGFSQAEPVAARPRRAAVLGIAAAVAAIVTLAAIVIYVITGKGVLVLEINQPDVTVTIDGANVAIRSPRDRIDVAIGRHNLEVKKDGFQTFTQGFEVARGRKVEIVAKLEPTTAAPLVRFGKPTTASAESPAPVSAELTGTAPPPRVPPIPPPKLVQSRLEVELPGPYTQFRTGGGGRFLVFHLKSAGQLAIFDVAEARVVQTIDVGAEDVRFAAGLDKLLVVMPGSRLIHRYSLKTFRREKSASLKLEDPVRIAVMGPNSAGPLALWASGDIVLWDVERMEPLAVKGDVLRGDPHYGFELRASADGRAFMGWTSGITGQRFSLLRLDGRTATVAATPDAFSFNGMWAQPNADAGLVLRFGGGMYTGDLRVIASSFEGAVLMATEDSRFFLAVRPQAGPHGRPRDRKKTASQAAICTTADRRPIATIEDLEPVTTSVIPTFWGYLGGEPRIRYLPTAKVIVTLPETNDRAVLRPFDLVEALQRSGEGYLVVLSAPPTRARTGSPFTYQIEVLSKAGGVRYALESGPKGMTISEAGLLRWKIPPRQDGQTARVVVAVRDAAGKELFHTFEIQVE